MTTVGNLDETPQPRPQEEDAESRQTRELSQELWGTLSHPRDHELPPPPPRTRSVAVRFDDSTFERLKTLAQRRHKGSD